MRAFVVKMQRTALTDEKGQYRGEERERKKQNEREEDIEGDQNGELDAGAKATPFQ